jgi:pilus assembly protein CpaE
VTYRVVLAAEDARVASQLATLALESADIVVTDVVTKPGDLMGLIGSVDIDVVLLHEQFAQVSVFELARELAGWVPQVGLVLLAHEQSRSLLAAALHAGFRGVAGLPLILPELESAVLVAGSWAHAVRPKLVADSMLDDGGHGVGAMVALAGSKGGVGTTTLAVHLALAAARGEIGRSICLVDFHLDSGDVRSMLNLPQRRTVADLVDVPGDLSSVQIDGSLSLHASGVRVLLAPLAGERGEQVPADTARRILGHLRTRFDAVIVDVGSTLLPGSAVAIEMADEVVMVVTPDTLSMRAANRVLGRWERARIRSEGVSVVLNRVTRDGDVQPGLVAKIVDAPLCRTGVPADYRALEAAANTGVSERLEDGRLLRAIDRLAEELQLTPHRRRARMAARRPFDGSTSQQPSNSRAESGVPVSGS